MDLLIVIIIILFVLWIAGFALSIGGSLIHLLLVVLIVIVIVRLVQGRGV